MAELMDAHSIKIDVKDMKAEINGAEYERFGIMKISWDDQLEAVEITVRGVKVNASP